MLVLSSTTSSIELVTSSTQSSDWTASFADITTTAFTLDGSQQGNVAAAATTTVVPAPAASTQRQIKQLSVVNKGAAAQSYRFQRNIAATARNLTADISLAPGEALEYLDGRGWVVKDALGGVKAGTLTDDAAFGVATSAVLPAGFLADETATDSVDEGDVGAARMTLDRQVLAVLGERDVTGTLNALNATATIDAKGFSSVSIHILVGLNGTVTFGFSNDNVNWIENVPCVRNDSSQGIVQTAASPFPFTGRFATNGYRYFRVRVSTFTSASSTVILHASTAISSVNLDAGNTVAFSPGTAATQLGKAEDAVHGSGDTGVAGWGVRKDDPTATAVTSADGDYSQLSVDDKGVQWVRPRQPVTYTAVYRLGNATVGTTNLAFTYVANTNKQLATIYHTGASTKTVRIRKISLILNTSTVAGVFNFEVRPLSATTAPATGNPAITPSKHNQADAAAEATCLALPTTAGSLVAANQPVGMPRTANFGAGAAVTNIAYVAPEMVLFDADASWDKKPLIMRAGVAEGYAINGRCTAASATTFMARIEFTEE